MNAPGKAGLRRPDARSQMFGVAQAGGVFSQPRHFRAGGGGAQRAGEGRIFAQDRVEQSEPDAGEKSPVGAGGACRRRARPSQKHMLRQRVNRRGARRALPRADRRREFRPRRRRRDRIEPWFSLPPDQVRVAPCKRIKLSRLKWRPRQSLARIHRMTQVFLVRTQRLVHNYQQIALY